jgi:type II secretory pathway pseudopilin PulG
MPWKNQAGLTLVEILVALALIMVGLVALMQWFPLGTQGIDTGKKQSTAVFLGEQQLEQIKSFALSTAAGQGWASLPANCGAPATPCLIAPFLTQNFNTIPGYPEYSRTVILAAGPTATTRLVRVQVGFQRVTEVGVFQGAANQIELATVLAQH